MITCTELGSCRENTSSCSFRNLNLLASKLCWGFLNKPYVGRPSLLFLPTRGLAFCLYSFFQGWEEGVAVRYCVLVFSFCIDEEKNPVWLPVMLNSLSQGPGVPQGSSNVRFHSAICSAASLMWPELFPVKATLATMEGASMHMGWVPLHKALGS